MNLLSESRQHKVVNMLPQVWLTSTKKVKNDANVSCARLPNSVILKVYVRIGGADESRPSVSKGRM
jgi:hypothetical protein